MTEREKLLFEKIEELIIMNIEQILDLPKSLKYVWREIVVTERRIKGQKTLFELVEDKNKEKKINNDKK